jgi:hypothetical protein
MPCWWSISLKFDYAVYNLDTNETEHDDTRLTWEHDPFGLSILGRFISQHIVLLDLSHIYPVPSRLDSAKG